jgi:hypothetical protein
MCLTVLTNEKLKSRQEARDARTKNVLNAIEDIRVYKALLKDDFMTDKIILLSPHRCMEYKRGDRYSVPGFTFRVHRDWMNRWVVEINRGLHAYQSEHQARKNYGDDVKQGSHSIFEMYIPKGAKYFLGVDGDIVSTELVFKPLPKKRIR